VKILLYILGTFFDNREGKTSASFFSQKMESWMHKQVASDVTGLQSSQKKTLEIGAGTFNQLNYEPVNATYDIIEHGTKSIKIPLNRIKSAITIQIFLKYQWIQNMIGSLPLLHLNIYAIYRRW